MERKYKDSGIEWIGKIPETWDVTKLSTLYTQRIEKVSDKDYPPLSVTMQGILPQLENAAKTNNGDDRKLVRVGDFAINSRSDRRGSCGISPYEGSVSLINTILKPREEMNPNFYNWLFHTSPFADEFYKWGHGIVDDLWTTRWQEMKNIFVVNPSKDDQQLIADYLDKKCGEIDSLIALQEQMIEKLKAYKQSVITEAVTKGLDPNAKLVPSGIDWIGDIPEGWLITDIKNLCISITDGSHFSPERQSEGMPYITAGDIRGKGIDYNNAMRIRLEDYNTLESQGCRPHKGDVLMVKDGATTGRVGMMTDDEKCVLLSSVAMLTPLSKVDSNYLMYLVQSNVIQAQIQLLMAGSAMPRVTLKKINSLKGLLIPLNTQRSIASYLDEKCADIDRLIALKQQKIESLKEYKKSVVYEAVTGKTTIE